MADLDVSDVLDDPDFWSTITVTRGVETVGSDGMGSITYGAPFTIQAVVYPAGAHLNLRRTAESDRVTGGIELITRAHLTEGNLDGTKPDKLSFQGRNYIVVTTNDWSIYGEGFFVVTATLSDIIPAN